MSTNNRSFDHLLLTLPEPREIELVDGIIATLAWIPQPGGQELKCYLISDAFDPPLISEGLHGNTIPDDDQQIRDVYMRFFEDDLARKGRAKVSGLR